MSTVLVGIFGIAIMLLLFMIGLPVSFSMGIVGLAGFAYLISADAGLSMLGITIFSNFSSYSLTVIPMFVLMGSIAFAAGISARLYDASYSIFGQIRGGIAIATIAACSGFSAICGSSSATAAAMGRVALPEMSRYRYSSTLATGCTAAGGSLGVLIPPSNLFIVYAILTQQSIGKLFIAGVIPGVILMLLFIGAIVFLCWRNPSLAPAGPRTTFRQKLAGLYGIIETFLLFVLVIGGLFTGWFTPTQAGAVGAAGVLVIALVRRKISWKGLSDAFEDTLLVTCMVMILVSLAGVFGCFMAVTKIPFILSSWVTGLSISPLVIMIIIIALYLIGGCFLDSFALMVLTVPIIYPGVIAMGFDPIWFGVQMTLAAEMGILTPPVGLNIFVVKGLVPDVPIEAIFKGVMPFVFALLVLVVLMMVFPEIATFLPRHMTY